MTMAAQAANPRDRVMQVIDEDRGELVEALSNGDPDRERQPQVPGAGLRRVVGAERRYGQVHGRHLPRRGREVDLFAVEPGRENAVGVEGHGRRSVAHLQRPRRRGAAGRSRRTGRAAIPSPGRVDDERVWGRGATDMKGGLIAQAFAARALARAGDPTQGRPDRRGRRRRGGHGPRGGRDGHRSGAATRPTPRSSRSPAVRRRRPGGRPVSPGLWWFSVTVPGKTTHASMRGETIRAGGLGAEVGVNAIDKGVDMFLAMRRLEDEWGQTKRHPLFAPGHFTIHPGVVIGGHQGRPRAVLRQRVHDDRVLLLVSPGRGSGGRPARDRGARPSRGPA